MQRKRSRVITVLSIAGLLVLLLGAFYVPVLLNMLYDKQTLEQINIKEQEFEIYKPSYADFEEKVHAIGMAVADGAELAFIEVSEEEAGEEASAWEMVSFSKTVMTEELKQLFGEELQIELDVKGLELSSCKLYTIFGTGKSSDNVLSGIQVYEMVFAPQTIMDGALSEKDFKYFECLQLYVDVEFHKIYAFKLYDCLGISEVDLVDVTEHGINSMTYYWGVGQQYQRNELEEVQGNYNDGEKIYSGIHEEQLTFGSNAQIYLGIEGYISESETMVRIGMQPFFDAFHSDTAVYSMTSYK